MAGASAERQENAFIRAINKTVKKNKNNPITVQAGSTKISGVVSASKYNGRQESGSEPYTDVILKIKNKSPINLSLKGESAPSLAGGGLRGLEAAVPGIGRKFMTEAFKKLKNDLKLQDGDKVPDVYGQISAKDKVKIVVGNTTMGGPIDYMYIGPMDVKDEYDDKKNILFLSGNFTEAEKYAQSHNLFFRLRARREDQRFDSKASSGGAPRIYGKSPSRGDTAGRIVVTDSVPSSAVIIRI